MISVNNDRQHVEGEGKQKTARVARIRALASALNEQNDTNLKVLRARVRGELGTWSTHDVSAEVNLIQAGSYSKNSALCDTFI